MQPSRASSVAACVHLRSSRSARMRHIRWMAMDRPPTNHATIAQPRAQKKISSAWHRPPCEAMTEETNTMEREKHLPGVFGPHPTALRTRAPGGGPQETGRNATSCFPVGPPIPRQEQHHHCWLAPLPLCAPPSTRPATGAGAACRPRPPRTAPPCLPRSAGCLRRPAGESTPTAGPPPLPRHPGQAQGGSGEPAAATTQQVSLSYPLLVCGLWYMIKIFGCAGTIPLSAPSS